MTAASCIGPSVPLPEPLSPFWTMPARAALKAAYSTMIRACWSWVSWIVKSSRKIMAGRMNAASTTAWPVSPFPTRRL